MRAGDETGLLESALLKGSLNVKAFREVLDRLLENLSDSSSSPFFPLFFFFLVFPLRHALRGYEEMMSIFPLAHLTAEQIQLD